jgi:hypothetical protein
LRCLRAARKTPKPLLRQIKKVAKRFGGREIIVVGDRGMIKSQQIEARGERQFHYITPITKPQIEALLKSDVLQQRSRQQRNGA